MNDDLISKHAVLDLIKTYNNSFASIFLCHQAGVDFARCVKELQSVTPTEQTHEEWCTDCKEYDKEQHCCHRFCKVIRQTVDEIKQAERTGCWNNHQVACLLAELFGDTCACNYNGIDEWLPEVCDFQDICPRTVGVACWEQFLKHRKRMVGDDNG